MQTQVITPEMMFQSNLGRELQRLRSHTNMSMEALGQRAGAHRNTVARWEQGQFGMSIWNFIMVAAALDMHPVELLARVTSPTAPPKKLPNSERDPRLAAAEKNALEKPA